MDVLRPGTEVTLLGGIRAVIVAVMIEDKAHVTYKASWPNGSNIEEKWIAEFMIERGQNLDVMEIFAPRFDPAPAVLASSSP